MADLPFSAESYSKLKFGSDSVAHQFGYELAEHVFKEHSEILLANECVVIPSPYNYVKNAATVMAQHFISHLNNLMVHANGSHVEWSIIHRKVSYTNDYGFLPKEKRRALIDNDEFYLNKGFIEGKVLLFIDDVKITGTHEDKLVQILEENALPNKALFLYYAEHDYQGHSADIEAQLNFAGIKTTNDYLKLAMQPNHHLIVRPIKFLLSLEESEFVHVMTQSQPLWREQLYFACLGEGYYKIPSYQPNFQILKRQVVDEHLLLPVAA
jgi:hypothetical protein